MENENSIVNIFSELWIKDGTPNVSKDSVQKHVNSDQHKEAKNLTLKSEIGAIPYEETVVQTSAIAKGFMRLKFNTAYYLAKHERQFSDYNGLLKLPNQEQCA